MSEQELIELVKENPNDSVLGAKLREYVWRNFIDKKETR